MAPAAIPRTPEELVETAARLLGEGGPAGLAGYDRYPAPVYATDAEGTLIYYNAVSTEFSGQVPTLGVDRWCIGWRLHTLEGQPVPLDQCPMAMVLSNRTPVRGEMIAERPDGKRTRAHAFPTPALDADGQLVGAVNLLVPSDGELHRKLLATALRCRTLAKGIGDRQACDALTKMAGECEQQAQVLRPD